MDLNQRKLTKFEWESVEIPVSQEVKDVLNILLDGYYDVNIKHNNCISLITFLKI